MIYTNTFKNKNILRENTIKGYKRALFCVTLQTLQTLQTHAVALNLWGNLPCKFMEQCKLCHTKPFAKLFKSETTPYHRFSPKIPNL